MHRASRLRPWWFVVVLGLLAFDSRAFADANPVPTREGSGLPPIVNSGVIAPLTSGSPSVLATGADGTWFPVPDVAPPPPDLSAREGHTIVFDSVNQRFVAFGGQTASGPRNDVWTHGINGLAPWTQSAVVGPAPAPRFQHAAVYDAAGQRMLVFGGDNGALMNDLWQLDLSAATPVWSPVATAGTPPSPRAGHSAVFDPVRRRMIVFGGRTPAVTNETWILDCTTTPATWQLAATGGALPPERSVHTAIFDTADDQMVIFGGLGTGYYLGDLWTLSMSTLEWTQIQALDGPDLPRDGVCSGYDPVHNRMFITSGDLWSLDLSSLAWTQWNLTPQPTRRTSAAFALDPTGHHGILNGGFVSGGYLSDSWLLTIPVSNPLWTAVPQGPPPPAINVRYAPAGIYDPLRDRFLMSGGASDNGPFGFTLFGDLAKLKIAADSGWVDLLASTPFGPRSAHGAVYDPIRDRVVVFGGYTGAFVNDLWLINASTLAVTMAAATGGPPEARDYFGAVYDPVRDRIVIYGGNDSGAPLGDVWALNLSPSLHWTRIVPAPGPAPAGRMLQDAIYDPFGDRLLVFGGFDGAAARNDLWALSLGGTPTWTQLSPAGTPPAPRYGYTLEYDPNRQRAILFGGAGYPTSPGSAFNDLWELKLGGQPLAWNQLSPAGPIPAPRYVHYGVYDPVHDRLLVSGGASTAGTLGDVWRLQFSPDGVTATEIALLSSDVRSDAVTLKWALSGDAATFARLERRDPASDWRTIESGAVSGSSVSFEDRDVVAGARYGYRLIAIAGSAPSTSSEVWIDVPSGPAFSLAGFSPNPATREARVSFSLAERTPATIEVIDVGGRRVASRRLDAPTPGVQTIAIAPEGGLVPGLYFVKLTQGAKTVTARGTVMR